MRNLTVLLALLFSFSLTTPAAASTTISGTISGDTIWTKADSPYIVSYLTVPAGASLTILPGTIIKINDGDSSGPLVIQGTLTVGATDATEQVIFTSIKDDSVGGDTNGDGSATTPQAGDWRNIIVTAGGTLNVSHATFRYGGRTTGYDYRCNGYCGYWYYAIAQLENYGGTIQVVSSIFDHATNTHIEQLSGTTTITDSTLSGAATAVSATGGALTLERDHFISNTKGFSTSPVTLTLNSNTFTDTPWNDLATLETYTSDGLNVSNGSALHISATLSGAHTLVREGFTYVLGSLNIMPTGTLTILPGAVVKIQPWASLFVSGTLTVGNTYSAEQVTITSWNDDSIGGDTNGDGSASVPQAGDWTNIIVKQGGTVQLSHTTIRYGGKHTGYDYYCSGAYCGYWYFAHSQLANNGGRVTILSSTFEHTAYTHLEQFSGTTTIADSVLSGATMALNSTNGALTLTNNAFVSNGIGFNVSSTALTLVSNRFTSTPVNDLGSGSTYSSNGVNSTTDHTALRVSLTIDRPLLLPREAFVYELSGSITSTGALTIAPGTIVKLYDTARIIVAGTLTIGGIQGDAASPLWTLITSLKDDSIGGDTNGDGSATIPQSGDWQNITAEEGGTINLFNTAVRYGGARYRYDYVCIWYSGYPCGYTASTNSQLFNHGGVLNVHNVRLSFAESHIDTNGGTTTVTHTGMTGTNYGTLKVSRGTLMMEGSSLHELMPNAPEAELSALDGTTVTAINNWWGDATGPTHYLNASGTGARIIGEVQYTPWQTSAPDLPEPIFTPPATSTPPTPATTTPACTENCNSNVLFLPGIMGSRLYWTDSSCLLVNCENKLWIPNRNDDVENLYMATGTSLLSDIYTKEDDILLRGGPDNSNFYQALADEMNLLVASGTIEAWKPIAYDWRYDYGHLLSGGLPLAGKIYYDVPTSFPYIIEELYTLAASSRTGKVTIVAHSNGGLLAKTLIQRLKDSGHADLVDNLILVASPQLGTPEAIGALLHGYDEKLMFRAIAHHSTQRKLAHDMPMTYNLLPSEKYLSTVSSPVITFDEDVPAHALWGDEISNAGEYLAYLLGVDNRPNPDYGELEDPAIANETLLSGALEWHANFDNWVAPTTTTVYQIAGWGKDTVAGIRYLNDAWLSDFSWDYEPILTEDGDGTVVTPSALGNDGQKYWVNLSAYGNDNPSASHAKIFEVPQLRTFIKNIIRKEDITNLGQYISSTRPSVIDIEKRLRYFLHSPLTLELYDGAGRHVGVSTTTGLIEEQISGASYDEFGEVKYISVPASASTTLVMRGEGTGRFTLNIQEVTGGVVTATATFANIPVSTSTFVTMSVSENPTLSSLSGLSIDRDGDGATDTQVLPGTILSPDVTPPEEHITFGTSTQKLLFAGLDTSDTSIVTTATSTSVTDVSGNTLRVPFISHTEKNSRILLTFNTLVYNESTVTIATTTIKYKWKTDSSGKFMMFAAFIKTGNTTLEAHYRPKKNQTIIMTKPTDFDDSDTDDDCDVRPIKQKLLGMVVPEIQTSIGNINVTY